MESPKSQFYHNVTVISFAIAEDIWNEKFNSIWYLDQLTSAQPRAIQFYQEKRETLNQEDIDFSSGEEDDDYDWILNYYEDCVIEINPKGVISWYEGEQFNATD